jgi:hypothetical protein
MDTSILLDEGCRSTSSWNDAVIHKLNCNCLLLNKENSFLQLNGENKKSIQTNKSKSKSRRLNKPNYYYRKYKYLVGDDGLLSKVKHINVFREFNTFIISKEFSKLR